MASSQQRHTLRGSCHCGQIAFTARNVNFEDAHKCNCGFCTKIGLFHVGIGHHNILLPAADSSSGELGEHNYALNWERPIPPGYDGKIGFYLSNIKNSKTRWYSCLKCFIFVFACRADSEDGSNERCTVSLRCLDLSSTGESMKSLTHRDRVFYCEMLSGTDEERKGEPFEGGEW